MSRMADTVLKKNNAAEKELEKRVIQHALEMDKKAEDRERKKKEMAKRRDEEIRRTLDMQINEKRMYQ